jgi:putative membrane-bound dehydrogenase-like protein
MLSRLFLALSLAFTAHGADFPALYNSETTPGTPMPAEEAAAKWKVPPGFKVQVFAAEPDVQNPIACAWDPRGRLWVAENYTYSERSLKFDPKLRDRVLIFEDTNGDGRHDKRTVFTEEVQHLTSVEVGLGGVWLMAPPQLLFIPDRDRDDKPDGPAEVVLDGFTVPPENYHNFANGLRWGPDGWLYGRVGASSPGRVGAPGTREAQRVPIAGGIWRYHPSFKSFEMLCHGTTNPWGSDWNEVGEMFFINTVNGHLWHMIPGAHYTRPHTIDPNPYVYELIDQHADHYHFDTGKGWTSSRDAGGGSDPLGGGHAHCGAMIYLADNWPTEYRGKLMTLNFHGRRINVERLEREGSGYVGKHEPDICFSADPFFRGIDLTYGPDGGVFVLDWSDTGECHENTGVHRTSGRIYKITYGEVKKPAAVDLTTLSVEDLIKLQESNNEWHVRMARRELANRASSRQPPGDPTQSGDLKKIVTLGVGTQKRLRALQTLWVVEGAIDRESQSLLLNDDDEIIRATAVRLLVDKHGIDWVSGERPSDERRFDPTIASQLAGLARSGSSGLVRLHVASALARLPLKWRPGIAGDLGTTASAQNDHNLPLLTWHALSPCLPDEAFVLAAAHNKFPVTRQFIARKIAATSESKDSQLNRLVELAGTKPAEFQVDVLKGFLQGFTGWRKARKPGSWDAFVSTANATGNVELLPRVRELSVLFGDGRALDDVKKVALDGKADLGARKAALQTLVDARPDDLREICEKTLSVRFLNTVAARGLALFDDPAIGTKLAKSYGSFHPSERGAVIETLVARPAFAKALLDEMKAGKIARADITAFHARQIRNFNDAELSKQLGVVWGEARESADDKRQLIAKLKASLTSDVLAKADKANGRAGFNLVCATCHILYGHGGQIGPDLTGSGRGNIDYLLENIVDPGAVVNADFRLHVLTMKDGRVINGMIAAKNDRTLTVKTMTETVTLERKEIEKDEELPQSLMPEGLLSGFNETQIRDLISYLMHPSQVPLPGGQ